MAFRHPGKDFELAALRAKQFRDQNRDTGMSTVNQGVASTSVGPGFNMNHSAGDFAKAAQEHSSFFDDYVGRLMSFDQYMNQGASPPLA